MILDQLPRGDDALESIPKTRLTHIRIASVGKNAGNIPEVTQWRLNVSGRVAATKIGVWYGDLGDLKREHDVDVIVNSESIFLEMARFHDPGVSAVIRWLGAKNNTDNNTSDDAIFRELIQRSTHIRPVPAGYTDGRKAGSQALATNLCQTLTPAWITPCANWKIPT